MEAQQKAAEVEESQEITISIRVPRNTPVRLVDAAVQSFAFVLDSPIHRDGLFDFSIAKAPENAYL